MLLLVLRGTGYGVGWGDHTMGGGGGGVQSRKPGTYISHNGSMGGLVYLPTLKN